MANIAQMGTTTQRPAEQIAYTFETKAADWATPVTSFDYKVLKIRADGTDLLDAAVDVTGTVATGPPSASTTTVTTTKLGPLTENEVYRVITIFSDANGNGPFERYFDVECRSETEAP